MAPREGQRGLSDQEPVQHVLHAARSSTAYAEVSTERQRQCQVCYSPTRYHISFRSLIMYQVEHTIPAASVHIRIRTLPSRNFFIASPRYSVLITALYGRTTPCSSLGSKVRR